MSLFLAKYVFWPYSSVPASRGEYEMMMLQLEKEKFGKERRPFNALPREERDKIAKERVKGDGKIWNFRIFANLQNIVATHTNDSTTRGKSNGPPQFVSGNIPSTWTRSGHSGTDDTNTKRCLRSKKQKIPFKIYYFFIFRRPKQHWQQFRPMI